MAGALADPFLTLAIGQGEGDKARAQVMKLDDPLMRALLEELSASTLAKRGPQVRAEALGDRVGVPLGKDGGALRHLGPGLVLGTRPTLIGDGLESSQRAHAAGSEVEGHGLARLGVGHPDLPVDKVDVLPAQIQKVLFAATIAHTESVEGPIEKIDILAGQQLRVLARVDELELARALDRGQAALGQWVVGADAQADRTLEEPAHHLGQGPTGRVAIGRLGAGGHHGLEVVEREVTHEHGPDHARHELDPVLVVGHALRLLRSDLVHAPEALEEAPARPLLPKLEDRHAGVALRLVPGDRLGADPERAVRDRVEVVARRSEQPEGALGFGEAPALDEPAGDLGHDTDAGLGDRRVGRDDGKARALSAAHSNLNRELAVARLFHGGGYFPWRIWRSRAAVASATVSCRLGVGVAALPFRAPHLRSPGLGLWPISSHKAARVIR